MPLFRPPDVVDLKAKQNVKGLIKALRNTTVKTRMDAALALGQIADKRAVAPLIAALKDRHEQVRLVAAWALGEVGDTGAAQPLIGALQDGASHVRQAAAEALGKVFAEVELELWIWESPVEPLVAALKDDSGYVRLAAAIALWRIGDPHAVEPLISALEDGDAKVRCIAAKVLGVIGDARAAEPLVAALKGREEDVRRAVAEALVKIGSPAVRPLIAALKYKDWNLRTAAANVLRDIGWQPDLNSVGATYWIAKRQWDRCVEIGKPAVRPLIANIKDSDSGVRKWVVEALGRTRDPRAVEPLIAALNDRDAGVRKASATALGEIGDARAVEPLIAGLKHGGAQTLSSVQALTAIGAPAVEPLVATLRDGDGDVRKAAVDVLERLGWRPGPDEAGAIYYVTRGQWDRCVEIGAPAVEPLIAVLKLNRNVAATKVLGEIGDGRAVEPLIAALKDSSRSVRVAAAEALAGMYALGNLDERHCRSILAQREAMARPHRDHTSHDDYDRPCLGHNDSSKHDDSGIGVPFPL